MKSIVTLFTAILLATSSMSYADAGDRIGVRRVAVPSPERGQDLNVTLWYPAVAGGTPTLVGGNAVFEGIPARQDAPIADGPFPVILLSHGGLRAAPDQDGWIASRLAAQGFIVATQQRPNPGRLRASDAIREIWRRPGDLSATFTALERDPALAGKIDVQEVGVLGFLLGGSSALALAGARRDARAYARSCDDGGAGPDCAWFGKSGIDLHKIDVADVARSHLDPRIKTIVAVDPELAATFNTASLSRISIPVQIINLGRSMLPGLDAASLEARIPGARYELIPEATQFDAFGLCKPDGPAILASEGDDASLCGDGTLRRAEIHRRLAAMITAAFARHLQDGRRSGEAAGASN